MFLQKKTKIIATIGLASESEQVLEHILRQGADCIRLNFSHGSHEWHGGIIKKVRKLAKKLDRHVAIIADIQGPKMRVGRVPREGIALADGQKIALDTDKAEFENNIIPVPSRTFADGAQVGSTVFFDDGTISIKITAKKGSIFEATVIKGGTLLSNKGINVPYLEMSSSLLSTKDKADINFAVSAGADYLALSFLRDGNDVREAKKFLGGKTIKLIAKIERPEALEHIEEITNECDAIMIARGDLGIETPLWELPIRQKEIVERVRRCMKPVIVATQMLDSMIRNPLPTRAEVSDVANAVFDGADAVMLSGESASGRNPAEAVEMMRKILESTERTRQNGKQGLPQQATLMAALAKSASALSEELGAKAILIETLTGTSAKVISYFRPNNLIIAITNSEKTACELALVWGVVPFVLKKKSFTKMEDLMLPAIAMFKKKALLKTDDCVVCLYDEKLKAFGKADINTITIKHL